MLLRCCLKDWVCLLLFYALFCNVAPLRCLPFCCFMLSILNSLIDSVLMRCGFEPTALVKDVRILGCPAAPVATCIGMMALVRLEVSMQ